MFNNNIKTILLTAFIIISGCKKYEDGPYFSFRSKEERLINKWKINDIIINGSLNDASGVSMIFIEYQKGNSVVFQFTNESGEIETLKGSWKLTNDQKELHTDIEKGNNTYKKRQIIIRLKEKELWLQNTDENGDPVDEEVHLDPF